MKIKPDSIKKIEEATHYNDHTQALILVAEALGLDDYVEALDNLHNEHLEYGYLTEDIYQERNIIYRELMREVRANVKNATDVIGAL